METAVLLTEIGRRAVPGPALATLMTAVLPIVRWGSDDLQRALLPPAAAGELILTAGIREPSDPLPRIPATTVTDGTVVGHQARRPLLRAGRPRPAPGQLRLADRPRRRPAGKTGVVIIDPAAAGAHLTPTPTAAGGPEYTLRLDHAPVEHVLGPADCLEDLSGLAVAGACALADGALAGGPGADQEPCRAAASVRPPAGVVPGGRPADRRRLHRLAHAPPGHPVGVLAARHGPGRGPGRERRPRGGGVLVRTRGAPDRSNLPSPARRDGDGHQLPAASFLGPDQRSGAFPRRRRLPAGAAGMLIDLTPEQYALRDTLRSYFAGLLSPAQRVTLLTERHGTGVPRGRPDDGPRRLARGGLAHRLRRPRIRPDRTADLRERGGAGRHPAARRHPADRRPGAAGTRHPVAAGLLPAADPRGRDPLRHRLHRARGRHRPGRAAHQRGPGRRRVRGQRAEDLHHRRPRRRLHLARLPHRPGRAQAPGDHHPDREHRRPRVLLDPDHHPRRRPPRQRDLLRSRARPGPDAGRRRERRLAADHQPAQPRAGDARPGRADRRDGRPGRAVGRRAVAAQTRRTCG